MDASCGQHVTEARWLPQEQHLLYELAAANIENVLCLTTGIAAVGEMEVVSALGHHRH